MIGWFKLSMSKFYLSTLILIPNIIIAYCPNTAFLYFSLLLFHFLITDTFPELQLVVEQFEHSIIQWKFNKSPQKLVSQQIRKIDYLTFGTSVISSPMSLPSVMFPLFLYFYNYRYFSRIKVKFSLFHKNRPDL